MGDWKSIKINEIAKIEKCVAEFNVWELNITPYAKFKVKIFEGANGHFTGYTNILLKSMLDGSPECGVGYGKTIDEALQDTVQYFMKMLEEREGLTADDFEWSDPTDF